MAVKMYKAALKPCPFCGNAEQTVFGTDVADGWKWNVECDGCHMQTKYYDSEQEALEAWKGRYKEDEIEQDGYRTWRMHLDRYIREGVSRLTGADRSDSGDSLDT
jgi:Lar family restriction alleviation protein